MKELSKDEMKNLMGGELAPPGCGDGDTYCGTGTGVTCCPGYTCQDAGNGKGTGPGEDKLCNR